jgi:A/G-specific adenine glycosylase
MQLHDFVRIVLQWHKTNRREFDWRKTTNPYKILVAEILLHRTDSQKVEKVYQRFIEKCPTIYHLHRMEQNQVFSMIRHIGLFYRAERLKKIADQVVNKFDGRIPDKKEELMLLHGVGQYISNAMLCFAFKKRVPIVDTNVIRVYSRVFNIKSVRTRPRTDKQLWIFAEKMLPEEKFVEYNYALLDFASAICRAKNPVCSVCKAKSICRNPVL